MKYEMTSESKQAAGVTVHRIKALKSFVDVTEGDLGGWVQSTTNLSQEGACWVYGNAAVLGDAEVSGNAKVSGNVWVYDNAKVGGDATVSGDAKVYGGAWVSGNAKLYGGAWVSGNAKVGGDATVSGDAKVSGNAKVYGDAEVSGDKNHNVVYGHYLPGDIFRINGKDFMLTNVIGRDMTMAALNGYSRETSTIQVGNTSQVTKEEIMRIAATTDVRKIGRMIDVYTPPL